MTLTKASYSMINGASFNVLDYGAKGDGVTNDTDAFVAMCADVNAAGGGRIVIPKGVYIVGKQTFANGAGKGYAYLRTDFFFIKDCTKPVIVEGNGATLKLASGLRYGSFSPVTGSPFIPSSLPFTDPDYMADAGALIRVETSKQVSIRDIELDGNINNQIIGGSWGDTGIQLFNLGLNLDRNEQVDVSNVYTHHNGLDGVQIVWTGLSFATSDIYPHTLTNIVSTYNGRQGLSWVGGNNLTCNSCDFSFTGKNGVVSSAPGAGVDIEPESSVCINGVFINCRFFDNDGVGMLAPFPSVTSRCSFYGCTMIGTDNWSLWGNGTIFKYYGCRIVGPAINIFGSLSSEQSSKFTNCDFSMTAANSPTGAIYAGSARMEFAGAIGVIFESCAFDADVNNQLPFSPDSVKYSNCTFNQVGAGTYFTAGLFSGFNQIISAGTYGSNPTVYGELFVNGVPRPKQNYPQNLTGQEIQSDTGGAGLTTNRIAFSYSPTVWGAAVGGAKLGDIVFTTNPVSAGYVGSVCTSAGNPGTWNTFGLIS